MALDYGNYLTNNRDLYCFICFLPDAEGVLLEDARTREALTYTLSEFAAMKLTRVKPVIEAAA